jgi:hypothetical protein
MMKVLPSLEKAAEIHELLDLGWVERDVVLKVFGEATPETTMAVRGTIADRHAYHPDVDEVAVERALEGDRAVWEGLTHFERREVMLRIHERRALEEVENEADDAQLRAHRGSANYKRPHDRMPVWLEVLADKLGVEPKKLIGAARDYAQARVL